MSLSRWKMMAGVLGVSLGGLAVAGQCPKSDVKRTASRQGEPPIPLEVPVIPALPSGGAPALKLPPPPASPSTPAAPLDLPAPPPPAADLPILPAPTPVPSKPASAPAKPIEKPVLKPVENAGSKPLPSAPAPTPVLPAPAPAPELPAPVSSPVIPASRAETKPLLPPANSEPAKPAIPPSADLLPSKPSAPPVVNDLPPSKPTTPASSTPSLPPSAPTVAPSDPVIETKPAPKPEVRPEPQPEVRQAAAVGATKYRILLRVGEGEPTFEVKCGDDLVLKVVCEKIDIKSPEKGHGLSAVKAAGKVRFAGFGAEGTCDELAFLAGTGEVTLTGSVKVQVKDKLGRVESELSTETMKYRIDPSAVLAGGKP